MTEHAMQRLAALQAGLVETRETLAAHAARFARLASNPPAPVVAHQLFQTPRHVAAKLAELLDFEPGQRVLEPSAGLGRLLDALPEGVETVAVDSSPKCCEVLRGRPGLAVHEGDFLSFDAARLGTFDRVAMNPPFTMRADIRHVMHAIQFLRPGGLLASVVMATDHRRQAFRGWEWHDLPQGTFKEARTSVDTAIVVYQKPA